MNNIVRPDGAKNILGKKLKALRLAQGLSQQQVADGVSQYNISLTQKQLSAIELGIRALPDYELEAFVKYFEVSYGELFDI